MSVIAIAATDRNMCIGNEGSIPFPSDFQFFKEVTLNNVVIMGRKTWESLKSHPLRDRINIIVSTTLPHGRWYKKNNHRREPFWVVSSLNESLSLAKEKYPNLCHFIIGGESLYRESFEKNLLDTVMLTTFGIECRDCDTKFPISRSVLENSFKKWKTFEVNNDGEIPYMRTYYTNEL